MSKNKKVKNARKTIVNGIKFKSNLEATCYKKLIDNGFEPEYENKKFVLFNGFNKNNNIQVYAPRNQRRCKAKELMEEYTKKILPITYSPDFYMNINGINIFIEVKGHPNDAYPLKRKMFLYALNDNNEQTIFFEPHNEAQIDQLITMLINML